MTVNLNLRMTFKGKDEHAPLTDIRKILIIELWGIGDVVLSTVILPSLKRKFPNAEIVYLAKRHAEDVLKNHMAVNRVIVYDFPWTKFRGKYHFWKWNLVRIFKLINSLRNESFDLVMDARGDFRSNLLSFLIGGKRRLGYDWTGGGYFLTDRVKLDNDDNKHRIKHWIGLLDYLKIEEEKPVPYIFVNQEEEIWAEKFLSNKGIQGYELLVGIHPGAGIKTRCWPLESFKKIAEYIEKHYQAKVVLFIEPQGYGEALLEDGHFIEARLSLRELISVIAKLDLLICNDGGPMHLATAVNTPVLAIFGPGNINIISPYGDKNRIVIKKDMPCRPCRDYCKYKEAYCLTGILVEDVTKVIDEVIGRVDK